jgi:cyclopropane fatty-acyl-phospholipid synthase-like methyltransferase
MKNNQYKNYFKKHYNYTFTQKDIIEYKNWFYPQWKKVANIASLDQKTTILEIGSGAGGFYSFLLDKINQKNYVGVELDNEAVLFSNKYFKSNVFQCTSFEEYHSAKKFDHIFAFEVLEHLESPIGSLQKMHRMLKTDGTFIGTTPYPFEKNVLADKTHLFVLHPKNWERLFLNAGFSNVSLYPMSFLPTLWRIDKHLNFRIPFYIPFPKMIATCLIVAKK